MEDGRGTRHGKGASLRAVTGTVALARADRVLVTAHPAEPLNAVALRAGEAALTAAVDDAWDPPAVDQLRRLLARHLRERLPDDDAGTLHAEVVAAATVAALDLALREWRAAGARADDTAGCRERFLAVAPLLPPEP
jgi:hypothetical protein